MHLALLPIALATLATAAPYTYPNATSTTRPHCSRPTAASPPPNLPLNTRRPRSTDSECAQPGTLSCSLDGFEVGICGFDGEVRWVDVEVGKECRCIGEMMCTVVDVGVEGVVVQE